ncbi:hypothetical protein [Nocardia callitridis]|uniref:DNA-binding protein n=1 Tax=Nocardia callitridis TaxID=648753 RepID=A0ABP9KXI5_9NOCA
MLLPATQHDPRHATLDDAAFGAAPSLAAAELPAAVDAHSRWLRAVLLGGQGRYAAARTELRVLRTRSADPVALSLAASTQGSWTRQLGWHAEAAVLDGRAVALLAPRVPRADAAQDPERSPLDRAGTHPVRRMPSRDEALCDALTGLAADALGTGRLTLAQRLLERASVETLRLDHWRTTIRWHWVSAETAFAQGRAVVAMTHAEAALGVAETAPSVRHRVKSLLLVAAAAAVAGDGDRCRALAATVDQHCREHGLLPLRWACAMLRAGMDVPGAEAESRTYAGAISSRGGRFRADIGG